VNDVLVRSIRKLRLSGLLESLEIRLQEAKGNNLARLIHECRDLMVSGACGSVERGHLRVRAPIGVADGSGRGVFGGIFPNADRPGHRGDGSQREDACPSRLRRCGAQSAGHLDPGTGPRVMAGELQADAPDRGVHADGDLQEPIAERGHLCLEQIQV